MNLTDIAFLVAVVSLVPVVENLYKLVLRLQKLRRATSRVESLLLDESLAPEVRYLLSQVAADDRGNDLLEALRLSLEADQQARQSGTEQPDLS